MQPRDTAIPPSPAEPAADNQPNTFQFQPPPPPPWMSQHIQFQQPWINQHQQQAYQSYQYLPQRPMHYHHQQVPMQPQAPAPQPTNNDEVRCLWIGDLKPSMDARFLFEYFGGSAGGVGATKVIRNKRTRVSEGYGFIECVSHAAGQRILESYHGSPFKLNWAHFGFNGKPVDRTPDFRVFVGNLDLTVTDDVLLETFRAHNYTSIKRARVILDSNIGVSLGYGFVSFADETEKLRAIREMNGQLCLTREMTVAEAFYKNEDPNQTTQEDHPNQTTQEDRDYDDPTNANIFVGGLAVSVSEDELRCLFSPYGEINHVIIVAGKGCGYVEFVERHCADVAMQMLDGTQLGGQSIRLSRGRIRIVEPQADPNQWTWGHYYGYAPIYENYGYIPQYDPNHYGGGAYWGYGNFQPSNQQQQHEGNIQPPNQQQQHEGNIQPPNQQQQHEGNIQPPHQQQQHQGNIQPPHQQGNSQPPHQQQQHQGNIQPQHQQQQHQENIQPPHQK